MQFIFLKGFHMSKQDYHAKGQQDRKASRKDSIVDLFIGGGGSPKYHPPKGTANRDAYKKGWDSGKR